MGVNFPGSISMDDVLLFISGREWGIMCGNSLAVLVGGWMFMFMLMLMFMLIQSIGNANKVLQGRCMPNSIRIEAY